MKSKGRQDELVDLIVHDDVTEWLQLCPVHKQNATETETALRTTIGFAD
jgi:hypothetical protein